MSALVSPISSETRRPVCAAASSSAWVASSGPGGSVGAVQKRFDLLWGQERDDPFLVAFGGDREHPRDQSSVLGVPERAVVEEPMDGAEANVAGSGTVATVGFEVLEERADQGRVQLRELQSRRRRSGVLLGEAE